MPARLESTRPRSVTVCRRRIELPIVPCACIVMMFIAHASHPVDVFASRDVSCSGVEVGK